MSLISMQLRYILSGIVVAPLAPFLYLQGKYVRRKVGRLPDAEGEISGKYGEFDETIKLLTIGESTVAGVGAKNHAEALTGRFAEHLSRTNNVNVHWFAVGESGITVKETLQRLVPRLPNEKIDFILIALGGNDVFGLSSPRRWRREMTKLLTLLRGKYPQAKILTANVPMVRDFIAMPNPLRYVLSRLAKLQHYNSLEFIPKFENAFYYDDVKRVNDDFFSDGIHPSALGYDLWAAEMVEFMRKKLK